MYQICEILHKYNLWCPKGSFTAVVLSRNFDFLIPDAPELVHTFLEQEQDASCKRNAFMMLIHVDQVLNQGYNNSLIAVIYNVIIIILMPRLLQCSLQYIDFRTL